MAATNDADDDLYAYDGYEKGMSDLLSRLEVQQPRQDSGVTFEMMDNTMHTEAVGTLFTSQTAADVPLPVTIDATPRPVVETETHTQPRPKSSVYERYAARAEQMRKDTNGTIVELRQWLESFKLPQTVRSNGSECVTVKNEASRVFRKRSLSAHSAELITTGFPFQGSADDPICDNELAAHASEDEVKITSVVDECSNRLLSTALPYSPLEPMYGWNEGQRGREEYDSIERARASRLEADQRSVQDREELLEISIYDWEEAETHRKRAESNWPDDSLEASIVQELEYAERLTEEMSCMINYMDSRMYTIPRVWDVTDLPRRTRLYSNTVYFLKYLMRERRVVFLINARFNDLQEGRSKQPEQAIAEEIKVLENAMEIRCNAEVDYFKLLHDFLNWAIAHTILEIRDMTIGGPKQTRPNALTDDIPLPIVKDMIEEEPELLKLYDRLQDLEQTYFPERFRANLFSVKHPPSQKQHQYTPRGRQIPVRQQMLPQDGLTDDADNLEEVQCGARLMRTLPRSFKPQNTPLLRVMRLEPHPVPTQDKKMVGESTSPANPPETDYFRPPKPKRKLPLRMRSYPHKIEEYTPEPLHPCRLDKSPPAREQLNSQSGLSMNGEFLHAWS